MRHAHFVSSIMLVATSHEGDARDQHDAGDEVCMTHVG